MLKVICVILLSSLFQATFAKKCSEGPKLKDSLAKELKPPNGPWITYLCTIPELNCTTFTFEVAKDNPENGVVTYVRIGSKEHVASYTDKKQKDGVWKAYDDSNPDDKGIEFYIFALKSKKYSCYYGCDKTGENIAYLECDSYDHDSFKEIDEELEKFKQEVDFKFVPGVKLLSTHVECPGDVH